MSVSILADSGRSTISTHQFRIQHTNTVNSLLIKWYALLQSADFLFMLSTVPKLSETILQLGDLDYEWYRKFVAHQQNIASPTKVMKGRKAVNVDEDEDD